MEAFKELVITVDKAKPQYDKFYTNGNKLAGKRYYAFLNNITELAKVAREELSKARNSK